MDDDYDYNAKVTVTHPKPGRVSLAFKTPSGNSYNFEVDGESPELAPLLQQNFIFACLIDRGDKYNVLGFKGSDEELPYRHNQDRVI